MSDPARTVFVVHSGWERCTDGDRSVVHGLYTAKADAEKAAKSVRAEYAAFGCKPWDADEQNEDWDFDVHVDPVQIAADPIAWQPWKPTTYCDDGAYRRDRVLSLLSDWLGDFGIDLGEKPDAWAKLDGDRWAFRIDSGGKSIIVRVDIDADADFDGDRMVDKSRYVRVEINRV
jgi:hypothetical protein